MKVFNLTDVSTKKLEQHKLVRHTITVGAQLLEPGQSADVSDVQVQHLRKGLQSLVTAGALSIGQPPASYLAAKDAAKKAVVTAPALPAPSPTPTKPQSRRGDTIPSKGEG